MNINRTTQKQIARIVVVLLPHPAGAKHGTHADGVAHYAGAVLELDAGIALGLLANKRARRATAEEAATAIVTTIRSDAA